MRIVIVGCGFGGLFDARALRRTPAEVLVIDRNNYHLFQPLLYQVASAALGFRNLLAVLSSWIYSYIFFRRGSRLIARIVPPPEQP